MFKYAHDMNHDLGGARHVDAELQHSMKLFRAQRNFYIAGFALFLFLVIKRLVTLITSLAQLDIQAEAAMKQAKSASDAAKSMMGDDKTSGEKSPGGDSKELSKLKDLLQEKEKELNKAKSSEKAIKKQAESLEKEYDRLMSEHQKILKKVEVGTEKKKDS